MGPYLSYVATNDVTGSARGTVRAMGGIGAAASYKREPQYFTRFSRFASFFAQVSSSLRSAWTLSWNPAWPGSSSRDLMSASVGMSTPGMWISVYSGMNDDSYRCWNVVLDCSCSYGSPQARRAGLLLHHHSRFAPWPLGRIPVTAEPVQQPHRQKGRSARPRLVCASLNHSVPLLKVMENITRSVMSCYNGTQPLHKLGRSVTALSVGQVSMIPWGAFKELQNNFTVQWTAGQMHALVKKKLGEVKVTVPEPPESCRFLLTTRFVSLSARTSPTRSWWSSSRLSEVCPAVCSNMSKPARSWMTWRPWRPFPGKWGRLSWRPCCKGSVIREEDHLHSALGSLGVQTCWQFTVWLTKGLAAARQGRESLRAGEDGGWCFASEHSCQHPGQSKHHVSEPGGEQKMASVTGDVPEPLRIFSQSPQLSLTQLL